MSLQTIIQNRHSIRAYTSQPVEPEELQQILEAINRAPSAGNLQAFEVYVLTKAKHRETLVAASGGQEFLEQAPVVLIFCAHAARSAERYGKRGTGLYCIQDATIACTFAMLAAADLGLSTVWVGAFDEVTVRQVVGIPEEQRPVAILPIGHADGPPRLRPRRNLEDVIHKVT